ncbi:MAG: transporter substrate-binding domain-containing protein [Desulfobacterales bacterium]|jgi:ABC-type amino acid transport substrate-binding protein
MLALLPEAISAGTERDKLRVGISPFEPFVILNADSPRGVAIDSWEALIPYLGVGFEFVVCEGVADKLQKLGDGAIDVAIGGITITEDRESEIDFSHPIFNSGLDILIPDKSRPRFTYLMASLLRGEKLFFLEGLLLLFVIAGHVIWLTERSRPGRTTHFDRRYFPGVLEGIYWAIITASTVGYGDKVPKNWLGRLVTGVIIVICLPLFGYFIAQLSADITMHQLRADINGPEDLDHKLVAVVAGTTSQMEMASTKARLVAFDHAREAYDALLAGRVDAVVYDAPQLRYFAHHKSGGAVKVVGRLFALQEYGIALPQGSRLRERVNRAILTIKESGDLQRIHERWFAP